MEILLVKFMYYVQEVKGNAYILNFNEAILANDYVVYDSGHPANYIGPQDKNCGHHGFQISSQLVTIL